MNESPRSGGVPEKVFRCGSDGVSDPFGCVILAPLLLKSLFAFKLPLFVHRACSKAPAFRASAAIWFIFLVRTAEELR